MHPNFSLQSVLKNVYMHIFYLMWCKDIVLTIFIAKHWLNVILVSFKMSGDPNSKQIQCKSCMLHTIQCKTILSTAPLIWFLELKWPNCVFLNKFIILQERVERVFWLSVLLHNILFLIALKVPLTWIWHNLLYLYIYIYIYLFLASYLYLDDFADRPNLQHVSWVGLRLPKAFQQDWQNECCGGEICDPLVPGESNTRPTCHSHCGIFPSSLSNCLNMHLFLHWTKKDALAARQYIITRHCPCLVPHPVYFHELIHPEEAICSEHTLHSRLLAVVLATLWNSDFCRATNHKEAPDAF